MWVAGVSILIRLSQNFISWLCFLLFLDLAQLLNFPPGVGILAISLLLYCLISKLYSICAQYYSLHAARLKLLSYLVHFCRLLFLATKLLVLREMGETLLENTKMLEKMSWNLARWRILIIFTRFNFLLWVINIFSAKYFLSRKIFVNCVNIWVLPACAARVGVDVCSAPYLGGVMQSEY